MTEREIELQRARREGFTVGYKHGQVRASEAWGLTAAEIEEQAKRRYPITAARPRVETQSGTQYRINADGVLQFRVDGGWCGCGDDVTVDTLRKLLADPTEEVSE